MGDSYGGFPENQEGVRSFYSKTVRESKTEKIGDGPPTSYQAGYSKEKTSGRGGVYEKESHFHTDKDALTQPSARILPPTQFQEDRPEDLSSRMLDKFRSGFSVDSDRVFQDMQQQMQEMRSKGFKGHGWDSFKSFDHANSVAIDDKGMRGFSPSFPGKMYDPVRSESYYEYTKEKKSGPDGTTVKETKFTPDQGYTTTVQRELQPTARPPLPAHYTPPSSPAQNVQSPKGNKRVESHHNTYKLPASGDPPKIPPQDCTFSSADNQQQRYITEASFRTVAPGMPQENRPYSQSPSQSRSPTYLYNQPVGGNYSGGHPRDHGDNSYQQRNQPSGVRTPDLNAANQQQPASNAQRAPPYKQPPPSYPLATKGHGSVEEECDKLAEMMIKSMDQATNDPDFFGFCAFCSKSVIGETSGCSAMDQIYHTECFMCSSCNCLLSGRPFYAIDGKPYCEPHYLDSLEKCSSCLRPITDRILRATGKPFHPHCFVCVVCGHSLDGIKFTVDANNRVYCIRDFNERFAPRCSMCGHPILPESGQAETVRIVALDKSFHVDCYRCEDCGVSLSSDKEGSGCFPMNGHLYCQSCNAMRVRELTDKLN